MLTPQEKNQIRKVIAYRIAHPHVADMMKMFAEMSDDEVRNAIAEWKEYRKNELANLKARVAELEGEIT